MITRLQLSKISDTYGSVGILVRFGSLFPWVSKLRYQESIILFTFYPRSQPTFCISTNFVQTSPTQVPALSTK